MRATAQTDGTGDGRVGGRRVVAIVYFVVVGIAGLMGALLGAIGPVRLEPTLFFLVDLPPTVPGMVVYGVTTVGVVLGVLLGLVEAVSRVAGAKSG